MLSKGGASMFVDMASNFLNDYNRRLVGAGGTGSLKYYDAAQIKHMVSKKDSLGKVERRAAEQDSKVLKLLDVKRAHDIKGRVPKRWGAGEYATEEQYVGNIAVETAVRGAQFLLRDFEPACPLVIVGPSLLYWRTISAVPPWEKRCWLLGGEARVVPSMVEHIKARSGALVRGALKKVQVESDRGGIKLSFKFSKSEAEVLIVFKSDSEEHFEPSKVCELSDERAADMKIKTSDLKSSNFIQANLGSTVRVNCPRLYSKSIERWYHNPKTKTSKIPNVTAPFPWVWSKERSRYVKTSGPSYYLKPPYGKKTLTFAVAVLLIWGLLYLVWKVSLYYHNKRKASSDLVHQTVIDPGGSTEGGRTRTSLRD
jgi:hypothetical protein